MSQISIFHQYNPCLRLKAQVSSSRSYIGHLKPLTNTLHWPYSQWKQIGHSCTLLGIIVDQLSPIFNDTWDQVKVSNSLSLSWSCFVYQIYRARCMLSTLSSDYGVLAWLNAHIVDFIYIGGIGLIPYLNDCVLKTLKSQDLRKNIVRVFINVWSTNNKPWYINVQLLRELGILDLTKF